MPARRYAHVPSGTRAKTLVGVDSRWPARFYARLLGQSLRYGMPARRRPALAYVTVARTGLPERLVARGLVRFPKRPRPDLDSLLDALASAWADLAPDLPGAPTRPPELSALALRRASALTVFVFGGKPEPIVVAKVPGDAALLEVERRALEEAAPAGLAPRFLGRIGGAYVQQAVEGTPLRVPRVTPASAGRLEWREPHRELAAALARLAAATVRREGPDELERSLDLALKRGGLDDASRRTLEAAWRDVRRLDRAVLRHGDTSAQNCLFAGDRLVGLVDWERAKLRGAPGFDSWNAALSLIEHGVGVVRWSEQRMLAAFRAAWLDSPSFAGARESGREAARAAGVSDALLEPLELVFFGRRLGRRVEAPECYATGPETAARMLALVCAR